MTYFADCPLNNTDKTDFFSISYAEKNRKSFKLKQKSRMKSITENAKKVLFKPDFAEMFKF